MIIGLLFVYECFVGGAGCNCEDRGPTTTGEVTTPGQGKESGETCQYEGIGKTRLCICLCTEFILTNHSPNIQRQLLKRLFLQF